MQDTFGLEPKKHHCILCNSYPEYALHLLNLQGEKESRTECVWTFRFPAVNKGSNKKKNLKPTNKKDISSPSRVTDSYGASSSPQEEARAYSLCPRGRRPSRARWSSLPPPRGPPSGPLQSPRPRTFPCPLPVTPGPWCHPAHAARRALQAASASPARVLPRPPSGRA